MSRQGFVEAGNLLWRSDRSSREAEAKRGRILIEGCLLSVDGCCGQSALARLADLFDLQGPDAFLKAEGDFVACVIEEGALHLFKSLTSQYQLYYDSSGHHVSNRLAGCLPDKTVDWNLEYFVRHVLIVPGYQHASRETPINHVHRVRPGELVTIGENVTTRQLTSRNYTYGLDQAQRREDVAPQILDTLRRSIRNRFAAHPDAKACVEISGGLDSAFIAHLVGEQAPSGVKGVMFSRPDLPSHAISERYAKLVADASGIELSILPPDALPQDIDAAPCYSDEPSDFFWFGDIFSRAVANIAAPRSFVFTGFGADQLFLRSPAFLPYLLGRGEFRLFSKALPSASKLLGRGPLNLAWQSAVSQMPPNMHRRLIAAFANLPWRPFDVDDVSTERMFSSDLSWMRQAKPRAWFENKRTIEDKTLFGDDVICDDWGYFSASRAVTQPHFSRGDLMDASPYCDLPLMDFVYDEVSALLIHDFGGRYKELLRESMKGLVPEEVRARRNDSFVFDSFMRRYAKKNRSYFEDLLLDAPTDWVDRKGVQEALNQIEFGVTTSSTRSAIALMGYFRWRRAFVAHAHEFRREFAGGDRTREILAT